MALAYYPTYRRRLSPTTITYRHHLSPSPIAITYYYRPSLLPTNLRYGSLVMAAGNSGR